MLASVSRRITALESVRGSEPVPEDRVEFAHRVGLDELDDWQEDLLRSEADRVLLNCARQSGKSTMAGLLALHKALVAPGSLTLILAPAERQAKELFSKVAEAYRTLGHGSGEAIPADSYRKLGMELSNGSRIEALPGTEKTIRGFSGVDLLIVDEASRVADELYYAIRPMLAISSGRLMLLSTPYGKRGVFTRSGRAALAKLDGSATRSRPQTARASRPRFLRRSGRRCRLSSTARSMSARSRRQKTSSSPTR